MCRGQCDSTGVHRCEEARRQVTKGLRVLRTLAVTHHRLLTSKGKMEVPSQCAVLSQGASGAWEVLLSLKWVELI